MLKQNRQSVGRSCRYQGVDLSKIWLKLSGFLPFDSFFSLSFCCPVVSEAPINKDSVWSAVLTCSIWFIPQSELPITPVVPHPLCSLLIHHLITLKQQLFQGLISLDYFCCLQPEACVLSPAFWHLSLISVTKWSVSLTSSTLPVCFYLCFCWASRLSCWDVLASLSKFCGSCANKMDQMSSPLIGFHLEAQTRFESNWVHRVWMTKEVHQALQQPFTSTLCSSCVISWHLLDCL